ELAAVQPITQSRAVAENAQHDLPPSKRGPTTTICLTVIYLTPNIKLLFLVKQPGAMQWFTSHVPVRCRDGRSCALAPSPLVDSPSSNYLPSKRPTDRGQRR